MRLSMVVAIIAAASFVTPPASAQETDPPVRVGRVAALAGAVSFHLAGGEQWERASINLPLTDGAALWTQPGAAATIGVSGNRIELDGATELDVDKLDEHALVATQPQGDTYWRVLTLPSGDTATVQTPRGTVAFGAPGRYEIISGDTDHPTAVTVVEGRATVTGLPADVEIGPNQTLTITGDGTATPFVPTLRATVRDAFLERMLAAERAPVRHVAMPPAVALMTGAEILSEVGNWSESPDDGPVWYPPAPAGFVPYRDGHWAYVAPWGWTWVDDAPWGFAPTHYGRWAEFGGRWGWIPGREWAPERPPIYAPALVAFIAGAALGSSVGWVPLGPHDEYRPGFHASPRYVEGFNRPTGANVNVTVINRQAVTVVPTQVMVNSGNVAQAFRAAPPLPATVTPQSVQFQAPVTPTHATLGATSAVLREVAPREMEGPPRPAAPGPAIASPGHVGAALVGGAVAGGAAAALLHPGGLPALRPHGVVPSAAPPSGPTTPAAPPPPVVPHPQVARPAPPAPRTPTERIVSPPASRPEPPHPAPSRAEPSRAEPEHPLAPRPEVARPHPAPPPRPAPRPPQEAARPPPRPEPPARPAPPRPPRRQEEEQHRP